MKKLSSHQSQTLFQDLTFYFQFPGLQSLAEMLIFHLFHIVWELSNIYYRCKNAKNARSRCCLSRFTSIVKSELDLLWCPSLIKRTHRKQSHCASKVNASSLRKSSLRDKWTSCELWSSRVENKQIALLDPNVLSSLGPNGGFWQGCGALTLGIQLQCREENESDVSAFSCWDVQTDWWD